MKKTIIANSGLSKTGKSDTMKKIVKLILSNYPDAVVQPIDIDYSQDIKVYITLNGLKIGIESEGDPKSRLFKSLEEFAEQNCDLILCATRTFGTTYYAVRELRQMYGYDIIWVSNYRSSQKNHEDLNQLSAKHIFELINRLISDKTYSAQQEGSLAHY